MSGSSLFASLGAALHSPLLSFKASTSLAKSNPALTAFEVDLSIQLDHLKFISFDDSSCLSMSWLCHAMQLVLSTHASAEAFMPELQQALQNGDTKWLDTYLDDSIKLLDTCNALREAIKEIRGYHALVKLALRAFDKAYIGEAQLRRAKTALCHCVDALKKKDEASSNAGLHLRSRLENCSSMLRRMGEKMLSIESSNKGTLFKLSLKEQMERQKAKGANAFLQEVCKTDGVVRSLKDRVERLLQRRKFPLKPTHISSLKGFAKSLKECSLELNSGLDSLHQHVEDVFNMLTTSRMILLEIYGRHCHRAL